jgi:hypothetical protein
MSARADCVALPSRSGKASRKPYSAEPIERINSPVAGIGMIAALDFDLAFGSKTSSSICREPSASTMRIGLRTRPTCV